MCMSGIPCPDCGSDDHEVKDTRPMAGYIRRRRLCHQCGQRFTTIERCHNSILASLEKDLVSEALEEAAELIRARLGLSGHI